jgi:hypothetical protein
MIYQYSRNNCHFFDNNTCGSCMMGHHLIISALSDSTWTRLAANSGQDAEVQSTGLHDPLTFVLWILAMGKLNYFEVLSADQ